MIRLTLSLREKPICPFPSEKAALSSLPVSSKLRALAAAAILLRHVPRA